MYTEFDHLCMRRALELAAQALYTAHPNPRVGCVIARDGHILGEGCTQGAGRNHAEIEALLDARGQGHDLHGATAYVSLEPCAHFGRTPPCATALIEARIARVIAAIEDPYHEVNGKGLEMLRSAGIDVRCGLLGAESRELNLGFFSRVQRGRPWVRVKIAASLDGKTALSDGRSQWITSEAARADGHAWRARACAVLTGIGTVKTDNPQLNVRLVDTPRQPVRVVLDSQFDIDPDAAVLREAGAWVVGAVQDDRRIDALRTRGVDTLVLPDQQREGAPQIDLAALMSELARRSFNEIHVEAGFKLNGALVRAGLADELLVYLAPKLMGEARGMVHLPALSDLAQAQPLRFHEVTMVGEDVRLLARLVQAE